MTNLSPSLLVKENPSSKEENPVAEGGEPIAADGGEPVAVDPWMQEGDF